MFDRFRGSPEGAMARDKKVVFVVVALFVVVVMGYAVSGPVGIISGAVVGAPIAFLMWRYL